MLFAMPSVRALAALGVSTVLIGCSRPDAGHTQAKPAEVNTLASTTSVPTAPQSSNIRPVSGTPPLAWARIAFAYHGVLLGPDLRPIALDATRVDVLMNSFLDSLGAGQSRTLETVAPGPEQLRVSAFKSALSVQLSGLPGPDLTRAKLEMIRSAVALLPVSERPAYLDKLSALVAVAQADGLLSSPSPALRAKLKALNVATEEQIVAPVNGEETEYMRACQAQDVPIPPPWPDDGWTNQGELPKEFTFASFPGTVSAEVLTNVTDKGLCLGLPRYNAQRGIEALGIICQSKKTGKACFWDNIDLKTSVRLTGTSVTLKPSAIQGGYELEENCTNCHRGENAFLIHPKTPLGSVKDRVPLVRYAPIGQKTWDNPKALAEKSSGSCADCHEIAAPSAPYCGLVRWAAGKTMPSAKSPAGWDTPDDEFKAHIEFLKKGCPMASLDAN